MKQKKVEPFGFQIEKPHHYVHPSLNWESDFKEWRVELPHSCDAWVIGESESKEEVIAELERFIAEAQETLEELRSAKKA